MNLFVHFEDVDLTIEQHHAHPALGSTALKRFISAAKPSKSSADRGNAVHLLAMFPDRADEVVERPPFNTGKGVRAAKAEWLEEHKGHYAFPPSEYQNVLGMAESLRSCKPLRAFLDHEHAQLEHTVIATTDTGLVAKARTDVRGPGKLANGDSCRIIVDVKTTKDIDADAFERLSVGPMGYDLQAAFYSDVERQRHQMAVKYYIYAVQNFPPYKVIRVRFSEGWMHTGRMLYEAAFRKAEVEQVTGRRLPMHWERSVVLQDPPLWHVARCERVLEHAKDISERFDASRRDT